MSRHGATNGLTAWLTESLTFALAGGGLGSQAVHSIPGQRLRAADESARRRISATRQHRSHTGSKPNEFATRSHT